MKNLYRSYICNARNLAMVASLFVMILLSGCYEKVDHILEIADSKMEQHPDSALMMLQSYSPSDNASEYDRALYGLLLTHARYKNFIDETNDSLISSSAKYFLTNGYNEEASRALFLLGTIQKNSNRLGEACVSFSRGLDIARDNGFYMWQGQCARGLLAIYKELYDSSAQLRYAKEAYDAFSKGKNEDWKNYTRIDVAVAYNNNGKFKEALSEIEVLQKLAMEQNDSLQLAVLTSIAGTSEYALAHYKKSIENYAKANSLDPSVLTDNHKYIISEVASKIDKDSLPVNLKSFVDSILSAEKDLTPFKILADKGDFKKAYYELEKYKNRQDSVLSLILKNDVSSSVGQYENAQRELREIEDKNDRLIISLVWLIVVIICLSLIWWYRERYLKKAIVEEKLLVDIESLRSDLSLQLEKLEVLHDKNKTMSESLEAVIRERYSRINDLCDAYYEKQFVESEKSHLSKKIKTVVKDFSDDKFLKTVGSYVDKYADGIYSSFLQDFPDLKEEQIRLFLYLVLGFSPRTISVIISQDTSVVYNRKSRLKARIKSSSSTRLDEYVKVLG